MIPARTPVVFIHGLWLHASSWQPWVDLFALKGYAPLAPGWPGEASTVADARRNPQAVAGYGIDDVTDHYASIIRSLNQEPVVIGHSIGGLLAQKLLGMGRSTPPRSRVSSRCRSLTPASRSCPTPGNKKKAVSLTAAQFRYGFGNALAAEESDALFEQHTIPSPGRPLFEAAFATFSKDSPAQVATDNEVRGPLLLISGQADHTVPDVVTPAAYKLYGDSRAVPELKQFPGRGHFLTVDHGWRIVTEYALDWLGRQGVRPIANSHASNHQLITPWRSPCSLAARP